MDVASGVPIKELLAGDSGARTVGDGSSQLEPLRKCFVMGLVLAEDQLVEIEDGPPTEECSTACMSPVS